MMFMGSVVFCFSLIFSIFSPAFAQAAPTPVDMVLVLAVDVSDSVDGSEYILQKRGIQEALLSDDFRSLLEQCNDSGIAITYMEWSGNETQPGQSVQVVGWTHLRSTKDIQQFTDQVTAAPRSSNGATDVELSLLTAEALIENNPMYTSENKVILVSGDGIQNVSPRNSLISMLPSTNMQAKRDEALFYTSRRLINKGYRISGVVVDSGSFTVLNTNLEEYFTNHVIGGAGSSVKSVNGYAEYSEGLLEILLRIANQCIA